MQGPEPDTGAPMITERTMHFVALVAIFVVAAALLFLSTEGNGSVPNDAVDSAVSIQTLPFQDDAVNLPAATVTAGDPTPSCLTPSHAAWYVHEPAADIPLTAWVVRDDGQGGGFDVALSAWRRTADGTLTEIACIDDRGSGAEQLVMAADGGDAYYFQIVAEELGEPDAGTVTFLLDEQRPAHDLFAFARWVDRTPYRDPGVDASSARREPGEMRPTCADLDATTWYGISTTEDAVLSATVRPADPATPTDLALALHTGAAVDALMEMACRDDAGVGDAERLEVPLAGGEVYWLQVGAVLGPDAGPGFYTLDIQGVQAVDLAPLPDGVFGGEPLEIAATASSGLPVSIETEGPCRVRDGSLTMLGAGLCTITATQAGDDTWAPAEPASTTLRIGRGRQAIEVEPFPPMTVGDRTPIGASVESGLPVQLTATGPCAIEDGELEASGAGTCVLRASQAGDTDWAPAEPITTTIRIGRGAQELTLGRVPRLTVGESAELEASSSTGLPVTLAAEGACELRDGALVAIGAGPCTVTASQGGDDDWAPAEPVSATVRIGRGQQAIELAPIADTVFGAPPQPLEATSGSGLRVDFAAEGPCEVRDGRLTATGAGTCELTASQAGDTDWAPAEPRVRRITIERATQDLELAPVEALTVGDTTELAASSTSGLPVELTASGACTIEDGTLVATGGGTCVLRASQAGDTDWAAAEPLVRRLAIAPASQAIELAPLPELVVDDTVELAASSDSGLPVAFETSGSCLVAEGRLRAIGAGPCTVTASQAGDDDWAPAEPVSATVRIGRGQQAIELGPVPPLMVGESAELEASSTSGLAVTLEASGACAIEDGMLTATEAGTCTVTASQAGDTDWAPAAVVSGAVEVPAPAPKPTPTPLPTPTPSPSPSPSPTPTPTPVPSPSPTPSPSPSPSPTPTPVPSPSPAPSPSPSPTPTATPSPSPSPSPTPTPSPTLAPSPSPSPTPAPSTAPSPSVTTSPSPSPTASPELTPLAAQRELMERTASFACEPIGPVPAFRPLSNDALAGITCEAPIEGATELKLFTFPDPWRLRLHHQARVEEGGADVRPDPKACGQGRTGVRKWEHGRVACLRPGGGSKVVLHWTDERTQTFGTIRADAGAGRRIDELWRTLDGRLAPDLGPPENEQPASSTSAG